MWEEQKAKEVSGDCDRERGTGRHTDRQAGRIAYYFFLWRENGDTKRVECERWNKSESNEKKVTRGISVLEKNQY